MNELINEVKLTDGHFHSILPTAKHPSKSIMDKSYSQL